MEKKHKLLLLFLGVILLAALYEFLQVSRSQDQAQLITLFRQGKTLTCGTQEVDQERFNFVSGTLTFVGKTQTPLSGITLSLKDCRSLE